MAAEIRGVSTELGDDMNLSIVATMAASARDKDLLQKPQELPPRDVYSRRSLGRAGPYAWHREPKGFPMPKRIAPDPVQPSVRCDRDSALLLRQNLSDKNNSV